MKSKRKGVVCPVRRCKVWVCSSSRRLVCTDDVPTPWTHRPAIVSTQKKKGSRKDDAASLLLDGHQLGGEG